MSNMTLEDLRTSLNNFMPVWCDIEQEGSGEIVIRTGLVEDDKGQLVPLGDVKASPASLSTLTDDELEAIANGASSLEAEVMREGLSLNATAYMRKHAATLRGLLERLG
jgi:hypothetical protein